jgi:hypothetical protein
MSTEADKKALNVQRVQKSVAKKLAQMNDEQKNEYKIKKKEINQKGQANFVAKKARLAEEAFKAAVAEGAQVLFETRNEDAIEAAVKERAQALYDTELKASLAGEVLDKAMSLAQAMFANADCNANNSAVGITAPSVAVNDVANNQGPTSVSDQIDDVTGQFPQYNRGTLVLPNKTWIGEDKGVVDVLTNLSDYLRDNWNSEQLAFIEKIEGMETILS